MNVIGVYKFSIDSLTNRIDLVFHKNIKYSSMKSQMIIIPEKKKKSFINLIQFLFNNVDRIFSSFILICISLTKMWICKRLNVWRSMISAIKESWESFLIWRNTFKSKGTSKEISYWKTAVNWRILFWIEIIKSNQI
jgi:hypothetical protein